MSTRLLPREEWPRLVGTELETVYPILPAGAQVVVVELDGAIVACWAVYALVHVECCWIAPEHRGNPRIARHLLRGMASTARVMGAERVQTASLTPEVSSLIVRLGGIKLPGEHFALPI